MTLTTERLRITAFTPEMADAVCRNSLDGETARFLPDEVFETPEEGRDAIERLIDAYQGTEGPFVYPVLLKSGANIGYVQLCPIPEGFEIGYHIAAPFTGKGYCTEAVLCFLPWIMARLNLDRVYGICAKENVRSAGVLKRCGFSMYFDGIDRYHGELRPVQKFIYTAHCFALRPDRSCVHDHGIMTEQWGNIKMKA
ncbi:MAG: GNAT family N-acetyltransferase, partial [Clostridia bacterium]|nr:GNAT family N-acetyltransferase [Clostridia bacterium]